MLLEIKNCNNIDEASIKIETGKLNIKYAINGTGKSTIVKAIAAFCNDDAQKKAELVPFKYRGDNNKKLPEITGLDEIKTIAIFNEDYISNYLFQPDDLLKGTFDVFIKSPEYDAHMLEIQKLLQDVHDTFQKHEELDELIQVFEQFVNGCGKSSSSIAKSSSIVKGLKDGNKLVNIPKGLESYEHYLHDEKNNVRWLKWQMDGSEYLNDTEICPFCTASVKNTKETILRVKEEYNHKDIEHLNNMLKVFSSLHLYFSEETYKQIEKITNNISGITDENREFLFSIKREAEILVNQLRRLKNIGFVALEKENRIADALGAYKIDLGNFSHFKSELSREKASIINKTLDKMLEKARDLSIEISQQKSAVKQTIRNYSKEINDFLQCAGYDYTVSIENEENSENYHLKIKHKQYNNNIGKINNYLSYGERNAFALVLFMYSAIKDNPDLIVLDDPISSFDGNKKFAILNMLFKNGNSLRGKTILLLTHEFSTVIDSLKNMKRLEGLVNADFLSNKRGRLKEVSVNVDNIKSSHEIARENISSQIDTINKLIYLRRLLELTNPKSMAYEMLSSLFHKRAVPSKKLSSTDFEDLNGAEISEANNEIRKHIVDFDYATEYQKIIDDEILKQLYRDAKSDYERIQLYRVRFNQNSSNDVIRKYINETFHVENDFLFQLNPCEYDTVPHFVVVECNLEMLGTDEIETEE